MPELQMDVAVANRFITSLSKSLQALCHGCMDFDSGIEIVGYINVNIDSGSKVDYVLNEKVLKSTTNSMTFVSNSFLARKEQQKQTRDGACSPIQDMNQQPPGVSHFHNRVRGSMHGSHSRGAASFSFAHHSGQKRSWAAMERDWRMTPKKQRDERHQYPSHSESLSTTAITHPHSLSNQNSGDANFKWPQTSVQSSDANNTDDQQEINIKKEIFDNENEKTTPQNEQDQSRTSDQETNDNSDEASKNTNVSIKHDPDASVTAADDETHASDGAANDNDTDFKGTFLEPPTVEDNQDNTEQNRNQTDTDDNFDTSQMPGKSGHNLRHDNQDESAVVADLPSENVTPGSEMPVEFDEAGEEGAYPQSVYSDAGEGSSDAGQFEVIEIDDEDEDVQAMFGGSRNKQDNTFDLPKHLGCHGYDSQTWSRFSHNVIPHQSHFQDDPSSSFLTTIRIPSKEECPFDPATQRYICPVCNNSYLTYASVCSHIKLKHQGRYEAYCDICGKGFQRKIHLQGHMAMHGQPMNFECSVCGTKYAHKTSLRAHERLVHGIAH